MNRNETTYRNPWHKPGKPEYGPECYRTTAKPRKVDDVLIYQRIAGVCWDCVRDGECITQRAGCSGTDDDVRAIVADVDAARAAR